MTGAVRGAAALGLALALVVGLWAGYGVPWPKGPDRYAAWFVVSLASLTALFEGRVGADLALAIAAVSAIVINEPLVAAEVVLIGGRLLKDAQVIESTPLSLNVYDFVLPDERHLHMVGRIEWDSLEALYPDLFETTTPEYMSRNAPKYAAAIAWKSLSSRSTAHPA